MYMIYRGIGFMYNIILFRVVYIIYNNSLVIFFGIMYLKIFFFIFIYRDKRFKCFFYFINVVGFKKLLGFIIF